MNSSFAPVVLFVYNRPDKTRATLETLRSNSLASQSDLFVFSDAAKNERARKGVELVREYLDGIGEGFQSVQVIRREENWGLAKSVIEGVSEVLREYGRVIVVEDDIRTAPQFLQFMNDALDYYQNQPRVFSVSGCHMPFEVSKNYSFDAYFTYRAMSWTWGTWLDCWENVDWKVEDYSDFLRDSKRMARLGKGGNDLCDMLDGQMRSKINSWAIRWCYHHAKHDAYGICPRGGLINNTGLDGSGTHSDGNEVITVWDEDFPKENFRFPEIVKIDEEINLNLAKVFEVPMFLSLRRRIGRKLRMLKGEY